MTEYPPINVLHVSTPKTWRGGEQQIAYLLSELPAKEINNSVLCPSEAPLANYCKRNGIAHYPLPKRFPTKLSNPFRLKKISQEWDIDLIHLHDAQAHTLAIYSALFAKLPIPLVLSRRVDFPIKSNAFSYFKYNHAQVKAIICVSETIKNVLRDQINNPEKLHVVHSGIDLSRFAKVKNEGKLRQEWDIPKDYWLIGNTSAIADHKDYWTFVNTADYLLKQGLKARFFIIGDGPEKAEIQHYIRKKQLQDAIHITGFREDIETILPELDIYLMTSKTEGLGTSILDAFGANVPVVATRAGGIPEMVSHEENGLLADTHDEKGLGKAVLRLVKNKDLKNKLIQGAQNTVKDFSKAKMGEETFEVYQSVLNGE